MSGKDHFWAQCRFAEYGLVCKARILGRCGGWKRKTEKKKRISQTGTKESAVPDIQLVEYRQMGLWDRIGRAAQTQAPNTTSAVPASPSKPLSPSISHSHPASSPYHPSPPPSSPYIQYHSPVGEKNGCCGLDQHRDVGLHDYVDAGVVAVGGEVWRVVDRLYLWHERGRGGLGCG